jgi:hypothetical protein
LLLSHLKLPQRLLDIFRRGARSDGLAEASQKAVIPSRKICIGLVIRIANMIRQVIEHVQGVAVLIPRVAASYCRLVRL